MAGVDHRARTPDAAGSVEAPDGVEIAWESFGAGRTTVLLMPTWAILPSRFWKAQVPFLARRYRVVTFDGRGSGRSGRPAGAAAYGQDRCVDDTLAVMEATGTDEAVLVALSRGAAWSLGVAADHPDRVLGLFLVGPSPGFAAGAPQRLRDSWARPVRDPRGWDTYNRHHWVGGGAEDFFAFFFDQMFPEPHSTQQVEDCTGWARGTTPQVLVDSTAATVGLDGAVAADAEDLCRRVRCPVLVVHGTADRVTPPEVGRRVAELTVGSLVLMEGSGHAPLARDPVAVNHLLADFVDRVRPPEPPPERVRPSSRHRPRRVLYLSSPIGLGHARRDVAVARALRERLPDVQVDWLAQHPVTAALDAAGEQVHPASALLLSESDHVEAAADEHDLHAFDAVRGMDEVLVATSSTTSCARRPTTWSWATRRGRWTTCCTRTPR
jgi:pimeloyl-ACP methyl ester carboxylesterase